MEFEKNLDNLTFKQMVALRISRVLERFSPSSVDVFLDMHS